MARQTIMLPSANSGEPDFTFMEMFGMSITLQLLLKQLAYLKKCLPSRRGEFSTVPGVGGSPVKPGDAGDCWKLAHLTATST